MSRDDLRHLITTIDRANAQNGVSIPVCSESDSKILLDPNEYSYLIDRLRAALELAKGGRVSVRRVISDHGANLDNANHEGYNPFPRRSIGVVAQQLTATEIVIQEILLREPLTIRFLESILVTLTSGLDNQRGLAKTHPYLSQGSKEKADLETVTSAIEAKLEALMLERDRKEASARAAFDMRMTTARRLHDPTVHFLGGMAI